MHALIVGYGYVGYYLTQALLGQGDTVIAWSRSTPLLLPDHKGVRHHKVDLSDCDAKLPADIDTVFYCAPPPGSLACDISLHAFLEKPGLSDVSSMVYFSSSGVYGNHHGHWVTENSELHLSSLHQESRVEAECQITKFCLAHDINLSVLRVAGIYGPDRLPIEKARLKTPLISKKEAPMVNLIYVNDLVTIAITLVEKVNGQMLFNVSDGVPKPWGETQRIVAELLAIQSAPEISKVKYWQESSPRLQVFLLNNKKLSSQKVRDFLGNVYTPTPLRGAIHRLLKTGS